MAESGKTNMDTLGLLAKKKESNKEKVSWKTWWKKIGRPSTGKFLESRQIQVFMFLLTIFALFGSDMKLSLTTGSGSDPLFDILILFAFGCFFLELLLSCLAVDHYIGGFFFTLDVIATGTLLMDLSSITESMLKEGGGGESDNAKDGSRAGRAGRVGSKAGRVVRVIRVIRLVRVVKLYKTYIDAQRRKEKNLAAGQMNTEDDEEEEMHSESRVGKKLSDLTTRRVILLVVTMLIVFPFVSIDHAEVISTSPDFGLDSVYLSWKLFSDALDDPIDMILEAYQKVYEISLLTFLYYHKPQRTYSANLQEEDTPNSFYFNNLCYFGIQELESEVHDKFLDHGYVHSITSQNLDNFSTSKEDEGNLTLGGLPTSVKERLTKPFDTICTVEGVRLRGVSLWEEGFCPEDKLRGIEFKLIRSQAFHNNEVMLVAVIDENIKLKEEAEFGAIMTVLVCILLSFGSLTFSSLSNKIVLNPIERMISKVDKIRRDPLFAMRLGDEQYKVKVGVAEPGGGNTVNDDDEEVEEETFLIRLKAFYKRLRGDDDPQQNTMETQILENTIIKLGTLLALGFGEAGSNIIGQNMGDDTSSGVNAMIPGAKVEAVYGFCDIRNFTDVTEVLQDKVMVFVNQVAEIVHSIVDSFWGAPNKNVGDAFLLVWRLTGNERKLIQKMCDMSVIAFCKVIANINSSAVLAEYREHPALLARLTNYRVRLGFGIHHGWAIEGAIGSEFKIDASYLSPHVNMSSRLEAATKQYKVQILMSEPLVRSCSVLMGKQFRCVDHVALKGTKTPTRLFTIDLYYQAVEVNRNIKIKTKNRYKLRMEREANKKIKLLDSYQVVQEFQNDESLRAMRAPFFLSFYQEFEKGYLNYEAGEWDVAQLMFEKTRNSISECPDDGPSVNLLTFMKEELAKGKKKEKWLGYRELSEK